METTCPKCGRPHDEAAGFCEECGAPMKAAQEPASGGAVDYAALAGKIGVETKKNVWDLSAKSRELAVDPGKAAVAQNFGSEYLKVEYRRNIFFLAGVQVPFELRLTPLVDDVKSVLVWFSPQIAGSEKAVYEIPVEDGVRLGKLISLQIPYLPSEKTSGLVPFRFYFGCLLKNGAKFYQMSTRHQVYRKGQSAESVVNQITINASEAGTINAGFHDLLNANRGHSADELLDKLNNMPCEFETKTLEETSWRPENLKVEGKSFVCEKLTLEIGGHLYHIAGKDIVKFGRKSELNDIVVADMRQAKNLTEYPNNTVSRSHAQIHYCGDSVNLFDASSYGTFINGVRPGDKGIPIPDEATVEFGDIHKLMKMQRCEQRPEAFICRVCPAHKIRSIVFTRKDDVPESFLLVWECCEMDDLGKDFAGLKIIRRNGGFILKTPDGKMRYLVPGNKIESGKIKITVKNFHQYGL